MKDLLESQTEIQELIDREVNKIVKQHGLFNSAHELYAVLKEEIEEQQEALNNFWDSVKKNDPNIEELVQIAAVAKAGIYWLTCKEPREYDE